MKSLDIPGRATSHRILLIEFCAVGRFIMSVSFPFVKAACGRFGLSCLWLRFALDPANRFANREHGIELDKDDVFTLAKEVDSFRPTHVLFSQIPAKSILEKLDELLPGLSFAVDGPPALGDGLPISANCRRINALEDLPSWLHIDAPNESWFLENVEPDFGFSPANKAATTMEPTIQVLTRSDCTYNAPIIKNPVYAAVDLTGCSKSGCAFCVDRTGRRLLRGRKVIELERQILSALRSYPFPSPKARLRVRVGDYALRKMIEIVEKIACIESRGIDLMMDCRSDHIVENSPALEKAAKILSGTPHRLHVCLIGVENFSTRELNRMNKGIWPWQNLAAIRSLRELEATNPHSFSFSEHGGLSTILFTPWTTLDDVAINLAIVAGFHLEELCGKLLTSRLRLYEGLPMTALARRDGLLIESYDDPAFDTAARNFYPKELPWRFMDERVETINRVLTRLERDPALAGDKVYERIQEWAMNESARTVERISPFALARRVVDKALSSDRPLSLDELLQEKPPSSFRKRIHARRATSPDVLRAIIAFLRYGLKRVTRVEWRDQTRELVQLLEGQPVYIRFVPDKRSGSDYMDVYFGPDLSEVEEAIELTGRLASSTTDSEREEAVVRLGKLYGYPECCSRSFAHLSVRCRHPGDQGLAILLRRGQTPGAIPQELNPFGVMDWAPCSFTCQASLRTVREMLDIVRRDVSWKFADSWSRALRAPFVFTIDECAETIELLNAVNTGNTFKYRGLRVYREGPVTAALECGDTITFEDGSTTITASGRRIASFYLRVAPFWYKRSFDAKLWHLYALEFFQPIASPVRTQTEIEVPHAPSRPEPAPFIVDLADRISCELQKNNNFKGFIATSVVPNPDGFVEVTLCYDEMSGEKEQLIILVQPLGKAGPYYRAVGEFALSYRGDTPLDSTRKIAAFDAFTALFCG